MAANNRPKIHFETVDELLGVPQIVDGTEEIKIQKIVPFKNHPFKVIDDERMEELVESIKTNGVITPVLVRNLDNGMYEMISGHRRLHAAEIAGLDTIPAVVKQMSDDEAVIAMVDANVQREEILPSERAWSLKMKMDAMKHQGERIDLTCGTEFHKQEDNGAKTRDLIGKEIGISGRQVTKYIHLTDLIPEFMKLVDEKRINISLGVELSSFEPEVQHWMFEYRRDLGILTPEMVQAVKAKDKGIGLSQGMVQNILNSAVPMPTEPKKVVLKDKQINKYFPDNFTARQKEDVILNLLAQWAREREENE